MVETVPPGRHLVEAPLRGWLRRRKRLVQASLKRGAEVSGERTHLACCSRHLAGDVRRCGGDDWGDRSQKVPWPVKEAGVPSPAQVLAVVGVLGMPIPPAMERDGNFSLCHLRETLTFV
jgi:hypothetical protein